MRRDGRAVLTRGRTEPAAVSIEVEADRVRVVGALDEAGLCALRAILGSHRDVCRRQATAGRQLHLDLRGVTACSCALLRLLLSTGHAFRARGMHLEVVGLDEALTAASGAGPADRL